MTAGRDDIETLPARLLQSGHRLVWVQRTVVAVRPHPKIPARRVVICETTAGRQVTYDWGAETPIVVYKARQAV